MAPIATPRCGSGPCFPFWGGSPSPPLPGQRPGLLDAHSSPCSGNSVVPPAPPPPCASSDRDLRAFAHGGLRSHLSSPLTPGPHNLEGRPFAPRPILPDCEGTEFSALLSTDCHGVPRTLRPWGLAGARSRPPGGAPLPLAPLWGPPILTKKERLVIRALMADSPAAGQELLLAF